MRPLDFPLLADECINRHVVQSLRRYSRDVCTVLEEGLVGATDHDILCHAHRHGRVVLTHDSDFGLLAIRKGQPFIGIIYLRPGHISSSFVCDVLDRIQSIVEEARPPFILVAERRGEAVRVRLREGQPDSGVIP